MQAIEDNLITPVKAVKEGIIGLGDAIQERVITPGVAIGGQLVAVGDAVKEGWVTAAGMRVSLRAMQL